MATNKKVFLSYSSSDKEIALQIAKGLKERGVSLPEVEFGNIKYGDNFILATQNALENADVVIAIVTKNWIKSQWATFELGASIAKNKTILPIKMDEDYPELLKHVVAIDAMNLTTDDMLNLIVRRINTSANSGFASAGGDE